MKNGREKAWGILPHNPWHRRRMSSLLFSTLKGYIRLVLHSVLTESYTQHMKHTTEGLLRDKHENAKQ